MTLVRIPVLALLAMTSLLPSSALPASDPLLFVSSFAGGDRGGISAFRFSLTDGSLAPLARTEGLEHPFYLAVTSDGRFLYAVHAQAFGGPEDEEVAAFAIDVPSGRLAPLNRQSSRGSATCYLETDATGRSLLLANYSSGSVASLPIREDGSLGEAASWIRHSGASGVNPKRQDAPYAHCIVPGPDNRFAYAADLGLDQILVYRLDAATATLHPASPPFAATAPGAGPRHLAWGPGGTDLYAVDELANTVTHYRLDPGTGALTRMRSQSTLPEDFTGTSHTADLKFTPDGRFLFATNRGHDSIAGFRRDTDGTLQRIAVVPSLGKGPQNLLVTPDGRWLLCANMPGNQVRVFRIDAEGGIHPVHEATELPMPSCLRLVPTR
jgi:6-phosphogluconolactonase